MTPTLPPFVRPGSLHSPTFCWMLCDPSVFYCIWFWPSADAENTKPDHDEKSLHRHTIPCFASSKSPFGLLLGSRETPHASHHETEEERCLRRNQRRAARAVWVRCEPSTPRRDPKTGGLARSSRRRAQPFLPSHCRSEGNQACLPALKFKPRRDNAFRTSRQVSENSELFKKLDPGTQFQWERIFSAVQPCRSLRGSEAEPTTNFRYSSFRGYERSLDPRRLRRAFRHSRTNSASPKGLRRPSAFGSELRRGKVRLAFRLNTESPVKTRPRYASLSASQWLSRSGIPRPPLRVRWIQTCLRTIGLAPPQSNLERDRCSANRCALGRGSTANR